MSFYFSFNHKIFPRDNPALRVVSINSTALCHMYWVEIDRLYQLVWKRHDNRTISISLRRVKIHVKIYVLFSKTRFISCWEITTMENHVIGVIKDTFFIIIVLNNIILISRFGVQPTTYILTMQSTKFHVVLGICSLFAVCKDLTLWMGCFVVAFYKGWNCFIFIFIMKERKCVANKSL